jgi:hypothetical protein
LYNLTSRNTRTNCPINDFPNLGYCIVVRLRDQGYHLTLEHKGYWGGLLVLSPKIYFSDCKNLQDAANRLWKTYIKRLQKLSAQFDDSVGHIDKLDKEVALRKQKLKEFKQEYDKFLQKELTIAGAEAAKKILQAPAIWNSNQFGSEFVLPTISSQFINPQVICGHRPNGIAFIHISLVYLSQKGNRRSLCWVSLHMDRKIALNDLQKQTLEILQTECKKIFRRARKQKLV